MGWLLSKPLVINLDVLKALSQCDDLHRLDRELDHLRDSDRLGAAVFSAQMRKCDLTPSAPALHLYMRCKGHRGDPIAYYGLTLPKPEEPRTK